MKEVSISVIPTVSKNKMITVGSVADMFSRLVNMESNKTEEEIIYSNILTYFKHNLSVLKCAMFNNCVKQFTIKQIKKGKGVSI